MQSQQISALRLLHLLDDENIPVEHNIFLSTPAHEIIEEITHKANKYVAEKLASGLPNKALLRRQAAPNPRRLQTFAERMTKIGYEMDISSSSSLQNSLFNVADDDIRKVCQTSPHLQSKGAKGSVPGNGDFAHQVYATSQILCGRENARVNVPSLRA